MGRYRSIVKVGEGENAVRAGEVFTADEDDPRVRPGLVVLLPDETPEPVKAAFEQREQPAGDSSDPRGDAPAQGTEVAEGETGTVTGDGSGEPAAPIDEGEQPPRSHHRRS